MKEHVSSGCSAGSERKRTLSTLQKEQNETPTHWGNCFPLRGWWGPKSCYLQRALLGVTQSSQWRDNKWSVGKTCCQISISHGQYFPCIAHLCCLNTAALFSTSLPQHQPYMASYIQRGTPMPHKQTWNDGYTGMEDALGQK